MSVRANFADVYLQEMSDKSIRGGTELAREIQLTDWSIAGILSNRVIFVLVLGGIYKYSTKCNWIILLEWLYLIILALIFSTISPFGHFAISSFRHFVISPFCVLNTPLT